MGVVADKVLDIIDDIEDIAKGHGIGLNAISEVTESLNSLSDEVDDLESAHEELEREYNNVLEENGDLSTETDELKAVPDSWDAWVEDCIDRLPVWASMGDNLKLTEILEKAVKEL